MESLEQLDNFLGHLLKNNSEANSQLAKQEDIEMAQRQLDTAPVEAEIQHAESDLSDDADFEHDPSDISAMIERSLPDPNEDEYLEMSDQDHNVDEAARQFIETLNTDHTESGVRVKQEPSTTYEEMGTLVKTEEDWMPYATGEESDEIPSENNMLMNHSVTSADQQRYEEEWKCFCDEGQSQLKIPSRAHYHCHLCSYVIYPLYRMRTHEMLKHKYVRPEFADKAIHCPYEDCDAIAPSISLYQKHLSSKHREKGRSKVHKRVHVMPQHSPHYVHHQQLFYSKLGFNENLRELYEPLKDGSVETVAKLGQVFWGCNACDFICRTRSKMKLHCGTAGHRSRIRSWDGSKRGGAAPSAVVQEENQWKCVPCNVGSQNRDSMLMHIKEHTHQVALTGLPSTDGERVKNCAVKLQRIPSDEESKPKDRTLEIYSHAMKTAKLKNFCKPCNMKLIYDDPQDLIIHRQGEVHKKHLRQNKPHLPTAVAKKALLYYCQDCKTQLMLRWGLELKAHVQTTKHRNNAAKNVVEERNTASKAAEQEFPGISIYYATSNLKRYCDSCGLNLIYKQPRDYENHLKGPYHIRMQAKAETGERPEETGQVAYLYHCEACDKQIIARHTGTIRQHLVCAEHLQKKKPPPGYSTRNGRNYYYCGICDVHLLVSWIPSKTEVKRHTDCLRHQTLLLERQEDMNDESEKDGSSASNPFSKIKDIGWHCDLCDITVAHRTSKFNHLHSGKHRERVRQLAAAGGDGERGWRCNVCNLDIASKKNKWKHLRSHSHKAKAESCSQAEVLSISDEEEEQQMQQPQPQDGGKWHCDLCDVTVWNQLEHCRSVKHVQQESLSRMQLTKPNQWHCTACNVTICQKQKTNHIEGYRHKLRVQQKALERHEEVIPEPGLEELKYCQECDFVTRSLSYWHKHLRSSSHLDRVPGDATKAAEAKTEKPDLESVSQKLEKGWHCNVCNKTLASRSTYERNKHVRSSTHQCRLMEIRSQNEGQCILKNEYRKIYKRMGDSRICNLCKMVFQGRKQWKNHTQTLTHRHALLDWKKSLKKTPVIKQEPVESVEEEEEEEEEAAGEEMKDEVVTWNMESTRSCKPCAFNTKVHALWKKHLSSAAHRLVMLHQQTPGGAPSPHQHKPKSSFAVRGSQGEMECVACGITAKNPVSWHNHINTEWHHENVLKQQAADAAKPSCKHSCKLCNRSWHLKADLLLHYRSKEHRINASNTKSLILPPDYLHSSGEFIIVDKDFYNCQLCDVTTRNQITWKYHLQTQRHLQKVAEYYGRRRSSVDSWSHQEPYLVLPQSPTESFTCKLCNITTRNEFTWSFHLKTIRHKEQVQKLCQKPKPAVSCSSTASEPASTINININLSKCSGSKSKVSSSSGSASCSRPKRKSAEDAENRIKDLSFLETMSTNKIMRMVETKQHLDQMEDASFSISEELRHATQAEYVNLEDDDDDDGHFQPRILQASSIRGKSWPTSDVEKEEWGSESERMPDDVAALLDSYQADDDSPLMAEDDDPLGPVAGSEPEFIVLDEANDEGHV
ncbi:hypothetical protein CAPTEDRAFT_187973 [Capitella teleta]|uniref:C2H2-type domain-containing protein n=1 Tax=Capitella teleta TaxID=283909 RepID=R7U4V2_CAPTE|nr:hypothetical protein CAPTEDRAFT_187973 [Capitella teleta]|eukprot:ELU01146.1 hypothetical protein CAPTEDRAFT_187973 [Capitella teleta]